MPTYYTETGARIRNPEAYAMTGAPMYKTRHDDKDINRPTAIYKLELEHGKKYIGKTADVDRRMDEHFTGNGSQVSKKFTPQSAEVIDQCPGFFADEMENYHTDKNIEKHGYDNVRGGRYTNSKTLKTDNDDDDDEGEEEQNCCHRCGREGHWANSCYAKTDVNGERI